MQPVRRKEGRKMENRKQETGNEKPTHWPVSKFRFPVSGFPFLSMLVPALPA